MIDPILIQLGPVAIRWYSLAYIAGVIGGLKYILVLARNYSPVFLDFIKLEDKLITYLILGIILGGRLAYVIFYHPNYYLIHPLEIIQTWKGGLSFHGGMIGVIIALRIFCLRYKLPFLALTDLIACATPIGIFFGRIANFINGELYGRPSDAPWAMILVPNETITRHPSQIYEALGEGIILFLILNIGFTKFKIYQKQGATSGLFLLLYGFFRFFIENFREPDAQLGIIIGNLTMGQLLSLPMMVAGIILILCRKGNKLGFKTVFNRPDQR